MSLNQATHVILTMYRAKQLVPYGILPAMSIRTTNYLSEIETIVILLITC
jgi:hypothetical protein